jgi:hypothetical protein
LNINDDISSIRRSIFTASVSNLDVECLNRIRGALLAPPPIQDDRCYNMVAELVRINEIHIDESDIYPVASAISRICSCLNEHLEINLYTIYTLANTTGLFFDLGVIKQNITTGIINLRILNVQLNRAAEIIEHINSLHIGADMSKTYKSILFCKKIVVALCNGDRNNLNLFTRQLRDNDIDIIGDIANVLNNDEREQLAEALTNLLSK